MIRVPLDVMRPNATTPPWQPLMLSVQNQGTLAVFWDVCGMLCTLSVWVKLRAWLYEAPIGLNGHLASAPPPPPRRAPR